MNCLTIKYSQVIKINLINLNCFDIFQRQIKYNILDLYELKELINFLTNDNIERPLFYNIKHKVNVFNEYDNYEMTHILFEKYEYSENSKDKEKILKEHKKDLIFGMSEENEKIEYYNDQDDYELMIHQNPFNENQINNILMDKILNVNFKNLSTLDDLIFYIINDIKNLNEDELKIFFHFMIIINKILLFCLEHLK